VKKVLNNLLKTLKGGEKMVKLIFKMEGKIAITILGVASLLMLLIAFMAPVMRVDAAHCTAGTVTPCTEDIRNTKHNLNENTDIGPITGTTEVCIFCHTPHGARGVIGTAPSGQAPLWNRAIKTTTGYQMYSSPNFDGIDVAGGPKGVSLACLSCHDGTISFDALINPPGSGGFIPGNLTDTALGGASMGLTFGGEGVGDKGTVQGATNGQNSMKEGNRPTSFLGGFLGGKQDFVGPTGAQGMEPYPNLTQDLRDDHPISMRMPSTDPQFTDALANSVIDGVEGTGVKHVSRYASKFWSNDKRDRIRLYPSATTGNSDFVECASCHNPHTPRPLFLRLPTINQTEFVGGANFNGGGFGTILINSLGGPVFNGATSVSPNDLAHNPNQGSLVCLSCHQK
jgi:hypothetical protein